MKSTLKIAQDIKGLAQRFEQLEIGVLWNVADKKRFYINDSILEFAAADLGFSFKFGLSGLYIDLVSGEYGSSLDIDDSELVRFEQLFRSFGPLLQENLGKTLFSTWTGRDQKVENITHFVGSENNSYFSELRN